MEQLARECEKHGVLWAVGSQLFNPANDDDMLVGEVHNIINKRYSAQLSKDVTRGLASLAYDGKPGGKVPYGYRREYSITRGGQKSWAGDVPDTDRYPDRPAADQPAAIVAEIYSRIFHGGKAGGIARIARNLEDRRIPTPRKQRTEGRSPFHWTSHAVLYLARNPAYAAMRVYHSVDATGQRSNRPADRRAAILEADGKPVEARWPALVDRDVWWKVQEILDNPARLKFRPGTGNHLLSGIAVCGQCGAKLYVHSGKSRGNVPYYICSHRAHAAVRVDWMDDYVEELLVSWLSDPEVLRWLWGQQASDSAELAAARAEVTRLEHQLEEARTQGEDINADAEFWARRAQKLKDRLLEVREAARPVSAMPLLEGVVGSDAATKWWELRSTDLAKARQLLRQIVGIALYPGTKGGDRYNTAIDPGRISWTPLTGPDRETVFGERLTGPRERASEAVLADPWASDRALGEKAGVHGRTIQIVRRELEESGAIEVIRRSGRGAPVGHGYRDGHRGAAQAVLAEEDLLPVFSATR